MLDLGCRRGHTQWVESGALEDVIQDTEVHRCIVTIVNFVAVCAEDLKVGFWCSCNDPSIAWGLGSAAPEVVNGGWLIPSLAAGPYSFPCFFRAAAHGNFASFHGNFVKVLLYCLMLYLVVTTAGGLPMLSVCIRAISKEVFIRMI
jgi:hypothetical protein